jgi:hypothetical protein
MPRRTRHSRRRQRFELLEPRHLLAGDDVLADALQLSFVPNTELSTAAELDPAGDVDLYRLELQAGDLLTVNVDTADEGFSLDGFLRLFDADGVQVTNNDDDPFGGGILDPAFDFAVVDSGMYFVGYSDVTNSGYDPNDASGNTGVATGDYTIRFLVTRGPGPDGNDTLADAVAIDPPRDTAATFDGEIASELDVDLFGIDLVQREALRVELVAPSAGGEVDGVLRLFAADGTPLAVLDHAVGAGPVVLPVTSAGRYFVGVSGSGNLAYDPATADSGTPGAVGGYTLRVLVSAAPQSDNDDTISTAAVLDPPRLVPVVRANRIAHALDVDLVGIRLAATEPLRLRLSTPAAGEALTGVLRVFDVQGQPLAQAPGVAGQALELELVAPADGLYFVGVSGLANLAYDPLIADSGQVGDVGDYELQVTVGVATAESEGNDTADLADLISTGSTVSGQVGSPADADFFRLRLADGGRLTATAAAAGSGLDSLLSLLTAGGQEIVSSDDLAAGNRDSGLVQHLPAGEYLLRVASANGSTGAYRLTTSLTAAAAPGAGLATGPFPTSVIAVDLNGDGIADLVSTNRFSADVSVFLGLGDGTYGLEQRFAAGAGAADVVAGDFNGDGRLDLATANRAADTVSVLRGIGDGTFAAAETVGVGTEPAALAAADLNQDGRLDLAVANFRSATVSVLSNQTSSVGGAVAFATSTHSVGSGPQDVALADLNADGRLDVVVASRTANSLSVLPGGAGGTLGGEVRVSAGSGPSSLAVADFNGDGRLDVAAANATPNAGAVVLLLGVAGATGVAFGAPQALDLRQAPQLTAAGDFTSSLLAGDFDGDQVLDLALVHTADRTVNVALGLGDGRFGRSRTVLVPPESRALAAADLNRDGRLDLAAVSGFSSRLVVRLGRGDGTFQGPVRFETGLNPLKSLAADVNHDGQDDLVVVNSGDVSLLVGAGDGSFGPERRIHAGDVTAVAAGDFNHDGRLDLAVADRQSGADTVAVLLGRGDGGFLAPVRHAVGEFPIALVAADITGDGQLDLATANFVANSVSLLVGSPDGSFLPAASFEVGSEPHDLAAGDFNGDGRADLAVANSRSDDVSILLANGTGLGPQTRLAVGDRPVALVAATLDPSTNAQRIDLAVVNSAADSVSLLRGNGQGGFTAAGQVAVGDNPTAITLVQLAGQSAVGPALAVANEAADTVSLLVNAGQFTFQARTLPAGDSPSSVTAVALGPQGSQAVAVTSGLENDVRLLLANGFGGAAGLVPLGAARQQARQATPLAADLDGDGVADLAVLDAAGRILVRRGRGEEPGAFAAPVLVNAGQAADAIFLVQVAGRAAVGAELSGGGRALYELAADGSVQASSLASAAVDVQAHGGGPLPGIGPAANPDAARIELVDLGQRLLVGAGDARPLLPGVLAGLTSGAVLDLVGVGGEADVLELRPGGGGVLRQFAAGGGAAGFRQFGSQVFRQTFDETEALAAGDFNGDGLVDVLALQPGSNELALMLGTAGGGLTNPRSLPVDGRPDAVRVADFDGDNRLDVAVLLGRLARIDVFRGDGAGGLSIVDRLPAGNAPSGLSTGDLNGDGRLDLLVGNAQGDVMVLPGRGDGTFEQFLRAGRSVAIAVGDLDGDGLDDWVVTNENRDRLVVQEEGQAEGLVQERADGITAPGAVRTADLNADGVADMIVANRGGNEVLVYLGQGGGEFASPRQFFAGTNPIDVTVGDVNGDGRPDVVVTNEGSNDVSVLLGDAQELLSPGVRVNVGDGPVSSLVTDFNEDGLADLVVTNSGSNSVFVLPGIGRGFFNDANPMVLPTGLSPQRALVGRFDDRPGLDLVTLNARSNSISVFSGFQAGSRQDMASGGVGPVAAVVDDFNFDGGLDLIVANNGDGALAVFLGGEQGFALSDTFFAEGFQNPTALALAEVGENGQIGLLVCNEGEETVGVFTRESIVPTNTVESALPGAALASITGAVVEVGLGAIGAAFKAVTALVFGFQAAVSDSGLDRGADGSDGGKTQPGLTETLWAGLDAVLEAGADWLESALGGLGGLGRRATGEGSTGQDADNLLERVLPMVPWEALERLWEQFQQQAPDRTGAEAPGASTETISSGALADAALADEDFDPRADVAAEAAIGPVAVQPARALRPVTRGGPAGPAAVTDALGAAVADEEAAADGADTSALVSATAGEQPWTLYAACASAALLAGAGGYAAIHWKRQKPSTMSNRHVRAE